MTRPVRAPAQGAARVVADDAPADRRRAVPARRADARRCSRGSCPRSSRRPRATSCRRIPIPTPVAGRRGRPALEEPRPVRGVRGDRAGDGRRSPRNGIAARPRSSCRRRVSRGAFLGAKVVGASGSSSACASLLVGRCSAGSTRPSCSSRCRSAGWVAFAVLAWLGLCAWAAITFLGLDRDRVDRGRGRDRVRGAARPVAAVGHPERSRSSCRAASPGRRWRWRPGRRSRPATSLDPGRLTHARPRSPLALGAVAAGRSGGRSSRPTCEPGPPSDDVARAQNPAISAGARSRARRGSRPCPAPSNGGGIRIDAGVSDSRERDPDLADDAPRRMLHARPSSRAATASGEANAATTSLIGPAGTSAASSAASHAADVPLEEPLGQHRPQLGAPLDAGAVRREARIVGQLGQPERHAEPRPLPLRPDRRPRSPRRRSRTSRTGRCSGARCRGDRARRPPTNAFCAWLTRLASVAPRIDTSTRWPRPATAPRLALARPTSAASTPTAPSIPVTTSLIATPDLGRAAASSSAAPVIDISPLVAWMMKS